MNASLFTFGISVMFAAITLRNFPRIRFLPYILIVTCFSAVPTFVVRTFGSPF